MLIIITPKFYTIVLKFLNCLKQDKMWRSLKTPKLEKGKSSHQRGETSCGQHAKWQIVQNPPTDCANYISACG